MSGWRKDRLQWPFLGQKYVYLITRNVFRCRDYVDFQLLAGCELCMPIWEYSLLSKLPLLFVYSLSQASAAMTRASTFVSSLPAGKGPQLDFLNLKWMRYLQIIIRWMEYCQDFTMARDVSVDEIKKVLKTITFVTYHHDHVFEVIGAVRNIT